MSCLMLQKDIAPLKKACGISLFKLLNGIDHINDKYTLPCSFRDTTHLIGVFSALRCMFSENVIPNMLFDKEQN